MIDTVINRFLRYVVLDTQSDPESSTQPSTEKQKNLGRLLVEELLAIGLSDAHLDEHGYAILSAPRCSPASDVAPGTKISFPRRPARSVFRDENMRPAGRLGLPAAYCA